MEDRIIELEKTIAFHEDTIEQLNQVLVGMQKKMASLEREFKLLRDQQSGGPYMKKPEEETPPPHY